MPTINYWRTWCKTCNDWTLHSSTGIGEEIEWHCKTCKTVFTEVKHSEIPEEKLMEQRERYSEDRKKNGVLGRFMDGRLFQQSNPLIDMFREPGCDVEISESDAGQKAIDDERVRQWNIKAEARRLARAGELAEIVRYSKLGRNDLCLCDSGKKYKHCCLSRIESFR